MAGDEEPSKNPFIRWKKHVDTNVLTTLQGVVGLPSVVSRNLSLRGWPEVEEARRKELEKQHEDQHGAQPQQDPPSSVDRSQETSPAENKPTGSSAVTADGSLRGGWSVSVFSPRDRDHCPRLHSSSNSFGPGTGSGTGSNSTPSDPGNPNDPNGWTTWPDWVQLARWHSFAAYSPYSPLNLRNMRQPRPLDLPAGEQSTLTFEDAFEDLLVVMCGRELTPIKERTEMHRVLGKMFPTGEPAFYWVRRLQAQGLLNGYFPRADQVRRQLEDRFDAESEEEKRRRRELDERRGRMWKWVWSRHHPIGDKRDGGNKSTSDSSDKSFEEWDPEDWVREMDSILSQTAKDVRRELNKDGHVFGELERVFKAVGKVGDAVSDFAHDNYSKTDNATNNANNANNSSNEQTQKNVAAAAAPEEESEEDYFSALAKASGSASASVSTATSTSTSTGTEPSSSIDTMTRTFNYGSEKHNTTPTTTTDRFSSSSNNKTKAVDGPFQNSTTEESVDPETGIRTIKTREEEVDKKGNRTMRTEIRQVNVDGDEISRQTSYSKSMSSSWSWSSSSGSGSGSGSGSQSQSHDDGGEGKDDKTGWFWR